MGGSFLLLYLCTNQKKNIKTITTNLFSNFRKTLLLQFSRDMSNKPISKYHIAVCLKKVSFFLHHHNLLLLISVIFIKQCCMANILICCVNYIYMQVVRVCPLTGLQWCIRVHAYSSQSPAASWLWVQPRYGAAGPDAWLWNVWQSMAAINRPAAGPGPGTHTHPHAGKKGGGIQYKNSGCTRNPPEQQLMIILYLNRQFINGIVNQSNVIDTYFKSTFNCGYKVWFQPWFVLSF